MSAPGQTMTDLEKALQDKLLSFQRDSRALLKAALTTSPGASIGAEFPGPDGERSLLLVQSSEKTRGFGSRQPATEVTLVNAEGRKFSVPGGLEGLDLPQIVALASHPISGQQLQRTVDRYARNGSEAQLGQQIYKQLCTQIQSLSNAGDYNGAIAAAEAVDRDAQVRGEALGRLITHSVADGQAYYLVTAVKEGKARLQHLEVMDGYRVSQWGHDAWVDRSYIDQQLRFAEQMNRAFGRRKGP